MRYLLKGFALMFCGYLGMAAVSFLVEALRGPPALARAHQLADGRVDGGPDHLRRSRTGSGGSPLGLRQPPVLAGYRKTRKALQLLA